MDKNTEQKEAIKVGTISFKFSLTMSEAEAVINHPKSKEAKALKQYMIDILRTAAQKMIDTKDEETVTKCKLPAPKRLEKS